MYWNEDKKKAAKALIIDEMSEGKSMRQICRDYDRTKVPNASTIFEWLDADAIFAKHYAKADNVRAEGLFDEILDIARTTEEGETVTEKETGTEIKRGDMLGHRRLKIDAIKWALSKMNSRKFGDKIDHTTDGKEIKNTITVGYGKKDLESYEDLL